MKRNPSGTQHGLLPEPLEAEVCSEVMTESLIMEKRSLKENAKKEEQRSEMGPGLGVEEEPIKEKQVFLIIL